jgi:lauroyl/myristoyl acyltransferase
VAELPRLAHGRLRAGTGRFPAVPAGAGALRSFLVSAGYTGGWWVVARMPEPAARALFSRLADRVWTRRGRSVRQLEANLARVVPSASRSALRELSRESLQSYARYWCEAFRLQTLPAAVAAAGVTVENIPELLDNIGAGRGVVCALPHMANWDLAGVWSAHAGVPVSTVAERVRPEVLFQRFCSYRAALGIDVLPLRAADGGAPEQDPMTVLAERLRAGGFVCLLADRDIGSRGVAVRLFGEAAQMPAGPAVLALRTGAALVPLTLWYDGDRMRMRLHPEIPPPPGMVTGVAGPAGAVPAAAVQEMTQQVADVFAAGIAEHPVDWHMLQRVFTADLRNPRSAEVPDAAPYGARPLPGGR